MNRRQKQVIEIETLHELLPALNYYQLLGLQEGTDQAEIDPAYRAEAPIATPPSAALSSRPRSTTSTARSMRPTASCATRTPAPPTTTSWPTAGAG